MRKSKYKDALISNKILYENFWFIFIRSFLSLRQLFATLDSKIKFFLGHLEKIVTANV